MSLVTSLLAGLLFGFGLIFSGMASPSKVLAFLDLAGAWDPSLILVMVGAIAVAGAGFAIAKRRAASWLGADMKLPTSNRIDARLMVGSALFGAGWGLVGLCPGPAMVALGFGQLKAVVFVVSMLVGMALFELLENWRRLRQAGPVS